MDYFDVLFAKTNGISSSSCYNEIEAMLKTTVGHSSKNLIPITLESGTYTTSGANLTYTVDKAAGTITLNGTSRTSGVIVLTVYEDSAGKITGNLYISGGGNENARFSGRDLTDNSGMYSWDGVTPSPASTGENDSQQIKPIAGHDNDYRYRILAGATFDNVVLKPMLRYASISDSTFEPYVTPTDEKKQDKPVILWEAALNSTGVSEVPISSLADNVANYSYLKVVVTNEVGSTITDQDAIMTNVEYDPAYIGQNVGQSTGILGFHEVDEHLVYDRLFIWVVSDGINISVVGLRDYNETSTAPDTVSGVFIRKIIGIPK